MSYRIVITEHTEGTAKSSDWLPLTKDVDGDTTYGYGPEITKVVRRERKVLEQEIESLDLAAVIRAVNGL